MNDQKNSKELIDILINCIKQEGALLQITAGIGFKAGYNDVTLDNLEFPKGCSPYFKGQLEEMIKAKCLAPNYRQITKLTSPFVKIKDN